MKNIPSGQIQLGVWGSGDTVRPPAGPAQSLGGGPRGKDPGSSEEPAIYTT